MGAVPPPPPLTLEDIRRREAERPARELRAAVRRARTPKWKRFLWHASMVVWPTRRAMDALGIDPRERW